MPLGTVRRAHPFLLGHSGLEVVPVRAVLHPPPEREDPLPKLLDVLPLLVRLRLPVDVAEPGGGGADVADVAEREPGDGVGGVGERVDERT